MFSAGPFFVALQLAPLLLGLRLWFEPVPASILRRCFVLSLVASGLVLGLSRGSAQDAVAVGGWLVVEGLCAQLVVDLPSLGVTSLTRSRVRRGGAALIAAGVAMGVLLATTSSYEDHVIGLARLGLVVSVLTGSFAVWASWRAMHPTSRGVPTWSQVIVPLAVVSAGSVLLFFSGRNGYENVLAVGAVMLPLLSVGLVVRDYVVSSQARRLANLLESPSSPAELEHVLRTTLDDPELLLVLRVADSERFVDTSGRTVSVERFDPQRRVEVRLEEEPIAVIVRGRSLAATNRRRAALIGVAKLAIEKAQLQALVLSQMNDIAESRLRIVDATDRARSAVERDLHDGAQQRLAALSLSMRLIADSAGSEDLACFARTSADALADAIVELQELARGIHPAVLSDAGLAAAIESLAERSPYPVSADVPTDRYTSTIELTGYLVVAEALANTTKHAEATHAEVTVTCDGDLLRLTVMDDGRGGANPGGGSGLQGLADRVATVGGRIQMISPPGGGTTITVELPLDRDVDSSGARA